MTVSNATDSGPETAPDEGRAPRSGLYAWLGGRPLSGKRLSRSFALLLAAAALISSIGTYAALKGAPPFGSDPEIVLLLVVVDLVLFLLLAFVVARRIVMIWAERRRGSAGSRMHVRLVVLFGLLSMTPAVVMAVFSALFFDLGLESWFSDRVRTALAESQAVANAYLEEHQKGIRGDALQIARELSYNANVLEGNARLFEQVLKVQAQLRGITEAIVFKKGGDVLARAGLTFVLEFEPIAPTALNDAADGEVVLLLSNNDDRVRALVKLDDFIDTYLYVGRFVDAQVLQKIRQTQAAVDQFDDLQEERFELQISFALLFILVALLLLMASVWVGLNFATQLSRPISLLISATEKVRGGDLTARVPDSSDDEIGVLSREFNSMTSQLAAQRDELVEASEQIDERRRFTEAVLTGVSAGVIGLDAEGLINLPNRSASTLLGLNLDQKLGQELAAVIPEFGPLLETARRRVGDGPAEGQIEVSHRDGQITLLVRISGERDDDGVVSGFVVTFDDVSQLLSAQRKAAWADVARRIAHEIKNPLTPIQLSAERLKRKYLKEVQTDPSVFETCTDTIIRQVGDIGRMVDEFSSFARMPEPVVKTENLSELCREAVFLQRNAHPDTDHVLELPEAPVRVPCDGRQISQAVTNLLKNAHDAIGGREGQDLPKGRILLRIAQDSTGASVTVEDNGKGLPTEERDRLTEPYVTTRTKGTGLGLAIVRKIMEDHGGGLTLGDAPGGGARVTLTLPVAVEEPDELDEDLDAKTVSHGA